jgi:carboxyl-terminal processing protease
VIRLTTARYYTPTGRCIQRPYENGSEEYYNDLANRYEHGEFVYADSIKFPDSLKYETPRGRIVYGGGGIMPDVFIPWDSTMFSDYWVELRRKGVLNSYTLQYVDKHRTDLLAAYPDSRKFNQEFTVSEPIIEEFKALAEIEGVKFDEEGWKTSEQLILIQIKALIARNLWDINAFYEVISVIDDEYGRAVSILGDEHEFRKLKIG